MEQKYIYYGMYPNTIKDKNVKITDNQNEKGYYLGSDDKYYIKVKANCYENTYRFSNGEIIKKNKSYYFKIEPIKWRILKETDEEIFIHSDKIIDTSLFDNITNDYKTSNIRKYLNDGFLNNAFTKEEIERIKDSNINCESALINFEKDETIYTKTDLITDKIFILSETEVLDKTLGFPDKAECCLERQRKGTDYSLARGLFQFFDNGWYYLRTKVLNNDSSESYVYFDGNIGVIDVIYYDGGLVPALVLKK